MFTRCVQEVAPSVAAYGISSGDTAQDGTPGDRLVHVPSVWRQARLVERHGRVLDRLGSGPAAWTAVEVLATLDEGMPDGATAREVLRDLHAPDLLEVVPDELLGVGDDPEPVAAFTELTQRLLEAASRPADQAVAHWLCALDSERREAAPDAESHLRAAVRAEPGWPCAEDRLAWYESDRGDAAAAAARWRHLGANPEESQDLATVEPFVPATPAPKPRGHCPRSLTRPESNEVLSCRCSINCVSSG